MMNMQAGDQFHRQFNISIFIEIDVRASIQFQFHTRVILKSSIQFRGSVELKFRCGWVAASQALLISAR
jgi:hypothetical protein